MTISRMFDLTGRVALVTGGSRGLGRCMARTFAEAGAHVVIASRDQEACEEYACELEAETGVRALGIGAHVGHWEELESLLDAVDDTFGRLDVLVNNAGMSPLYDSPETISERC